MGWISSPYPPALLARANTWTQPQSFAVGTVAAPSMTFSGDTDTGIYSVGANILGISVGGALVASFQTGLVGFTNGASLATAAVDGATLLLVARNAAAATQTVLTIVGAATVANSYITAQVGGTWTLASGQTWTVPAFSANGAISIGANLIKTTNLAIKEITASLLGIRNSGDTAYSGLILDVASVQSNLNFATGAILRTGNTDADTVLIQARDTGVGLVNIGRLVSAADPYIEATLGIRLAPVVQWGVPVQGVVIYNSVTNKLNFYNGTAWEVITSA